MMIDLDGCGEIKMILTLPIVVVAAAARVLRGSPSRAARWQSAANERHFDAGSQVGGAIARWGSKPEEIIHVRVAVSEGGAPSTSIFLNSDQIGFGTK